MVAVLRKRCYHGSSPQKKAATLVTVFKERLRPWSQSLEKTATMAAVLIKTLLFNHRLYKKLRPWYQHPKLWLKFSHIALSWWLSG